MKLLLLDKDETLVKPRSGNTFVQNPEDQELLPGVMEAIAKYSDAGYTIGVISNQGGVAAKYKSLRNAIDEMAFCLQLLEIELHEPVVEFALFCPDFEGKECYEVNLVLGDSGLIEPDWGKVHDHSCCRHLAGSFRKPNAGMIEAFKIMHCDDDVQVLMVGDRDEDEQAAKNAGVGFMWADAWRDER